MNETVLIDSSGWIEYFTEGSRCAQFSPAIENATQETTITPAIILFEVYKKIKTTTGREYAIRAVASIQQQTRVLPITGSAALTAVDASLQFKLSMADALIYTFAVGYGAILITGDRHFRGLPHVKLIE